MPWATSRNRLERGSSARYTAWPKPMIFPPFASRSVTHASVFGGVANGVDHVEGPAGRTPVERARQGGSTRGEGSGYVGAGTGDGAGGEGRGVEAVVGGRREVTLDGPGQPWVRSGAGDQADEVRRMTETGVGVERCGAAPPADGAAARMVGTAPMPRRVRCFGVRWGRGRSSGSSSTMSDRAARSPAPGGIPEPANGARTSKICGIDHPGPAPARPGTPIPRPRSAGEPSISSRAAPSKVCVACDLDRVVIAVVEEAFGCLARSPIVVSATTSPLRPGGAISSSTSGAVLFGVVVSGVVVSGVVVSGVGGCGPLLVMIPP